MNPLDCSICDSTDSDQWFTLVVTDPGDVTAGHLCSLDCLTDYVAKVYGLILADQEE